MAEEATTQGETGTATATAQGAATSQATDPSATAAAAVLASPDTAAAAADKSTEGQGGESKQSAAPAVPDTYEFKAPEGATVDEGRLTEFQAAAKEAGLSQEQFQKLADYGFKQLAAAANAPLETFEATQNQWFAEIKADPDLGGDKLDQNRALAKQAVATGGEELRQALISTGAISHPAVFRHFVRLGREIQDGSRLVTGKPASGHRDGSYEGIAARMYPGMVEAAGA